MVLITHSVHLCHLVFSSGKSTNKTSSNWKAGVCSGQLVSGDWNIQPGFAWFSMKLCPDVAHCEPVCTLMLKAQLRRSTASQNCEHGWRWWWLMFGGFENKRGSHRPGTKQQNRKYQSAVRCREKCVGPRSSRLKHNLKTLQGQSWSCFQDASTQKCVF